MLVLAGRAEKLAQRIRLAAVVLSQSIGYVVPLAGGGLAYLFLRREFGDKALLAEAGRGEADAAAP